MKYLILGAGPAGLTVANRLREMGEESFYVLEKEEEAGGLCRSAIVDGKPLDIGGGHFLDVRRPEVNDFLFQFMPMEEWNRYDRISKIRLGENIIDYPMESSIFQLPEDEQIAHLLSIAKAGCNTGQKKPEKFSEWIPWKLGEKIAEDYMIPYNSKLWSMNLDKLGTYWLEKLPNVSFEDTLRSCLKRDRVFESLPGHASFYYPKEHGYGELWLRMAERIKDKIEYGVEVSELDFTRRIINGQYKADIIINTIPWTSFETIRGVSEKFLDSILSLKSVSIVVKYYDEPVDTDAHWMYFPDESVEYHRILYRCNFCPGAKGYWTESNKKRADLEDGHWHYVNKYAYPVNTIRKREAISYILESAGDRKIFGLGRWGEWEHYNSDMTVLLAMQMADRLLGRS
ncbi:MAG: NAD(P)-binding protein [Lachnospiraceae bacterium]|nr:NAD(P)-binding protein [Lachnospiraceae bacterium]